MVCRIESEKSIQSDLIFQSAKDIRENCFTCVAMNPAGTVTKNAQVRFSQMMLFKYSLKFLYERSSHFSYLVRAKDV